MKPNKSAIAALLILSILSAIYAQDGHYWSENYGNVSMLLSGTVNASVEDLGAVFYNPARLGLIKNPAFAISAKVYQYRTLKLQNAGDEEVDFSNSSFGGAPSLAAGTFKLPFLEGHKFAYSFLTRQRTNVDFFTRIEREGDVVQSLPGKEIFNGKLDIGTNFKEEWIGMTWAPPTDKKFNIGLSTFISTLNKRANIGIDMNALNEFNQSGYSSSNRRYSYESYGLLWKLGFAAELPKLRLGITVTTPRINAYGKGSTLFENYLVGIDTTGDGTNDDVYIFNIQDNLKVKYKSPWAIGVGAGIPFKNVVVHLSAEWYNKIPSYEIMKIDPFIGQSTGDTISFQLIEDLHSIINFGVGIEWNFSEKVSAYGSMATDFSALPDDINRFSDFEETTNNSMFNADFFQFGGGISIHTKAVEITIGTTYTGADSSFESKMVFPDGDNTDPFVDSKLIFSQWRFILGFSFPFADKLAKNLEGESGR
jgi:hypothetical protein